MESEFLTESTRKLRKSLLVASLIGFAISYAGLRVSEVSLLGSKLSITRFEVIPFVLGIVVLYFPVTFTIFGLWDYSQFYWKHRLDIAEELSKETVTSAPEAKYRIDSLKEELRTLSKEISHAEIESSARAEMRDRMREIPKEIEKLLKIKRFYQGEGEGDSILELLFMRKLLKSMKILFDLYLPIFVGFYVVILLFFFTKIPELNDTTLKAGQEVTISEKVDANNTSQVTQVER